MKQNRYKKIPFTLLEVLIALMLITLTLPLLVTPFLYTQMDAIEQEKATKLEKIAQSSFTELLIALHKEQLSAKDLENKMPQIIPFSWYEKITKKKIEGEYFFKLLKPKKAVETKFTKLWQVTFTFKEAKKIHSFAYEFITTKKT